MLVTKFVVIYQKKFLFWPWFGIYCCSGPGFSQGYYCILCFRTMIGTFLLMWTNYRWIHMWICFLSRLCYTRLHGWESWIKHQFRCTIFMLILWFKDGFGFTCSDAYKNLHICFFFWRHWKYFECWYFYFAWLREKKWKRVVASYWINQGNGITNWSIVLFSLMILYVLLLSFTFTRMINLIIISAYKRSLH